MLSLKNKLIPTMSAVFLSTLLFSNAQAADLKSKFSDSDFALGYHLTTFSNGFSGRMKLSDKVSAQVILGVFDSVSNYEIRGRYILATDQKWDGYAFAGVGIWTKDDSDGFDDETVGAVSGGIGMEYDMQNLDASYPPITWSFELSAHTAEFDNHDFTNFTLGVSGHYRF